MPYDPQKHHRRSIRLPGYDYASAGAYFVTICTQVRHPWFGHVQQGQLQQNIAGNAIMETWRDLLLYFSHIALDEAILMPDHFHGILWITGDDAGARQPVVGRTAGTADGSLGRCMQAFKSLSTNVYIRGVKELGWEPFAGRLWQRNYYERIIRHDELETTREYIVSNPLRWRGL